MDWKRQGSRPIALQEKLGGKELSDDEWHDELWMAHDNGRSCRLWRTDLGRRRAHQVPVLRRQKQQSRPMNYGPCHCGLGNLSGTDVCTSGGRMDSDLCRSLTRTA